MVLWRYLVESRPPAAVTPGPMEAHRPRGGVIPTMVHRPGMQPLARAAFREGSVNSQCDDDMASRGDDCCFLRRLDEMGDDSVALTMKPCSRVGYEFFFSHQIFTRVECPGMITVSPSDLT